MMEGQLIYLSREPLWGNVQTTITLPLDGDDVDFTIVCKRAFNADVHLIKSAIDAPSIKTVRTPPSVRTAASARVSMHNGEEEHSIH